MKLFLNHGKNLTNICETSVKWGQRSFHYGNLRVPGPGTPSMPTLKEENQAAPRRPYKSDVLVASINGPFPRKKNTAFIFTTTSSGDSYIPRTWTPVDRNSLEWMKPNKLKVIRASRSGWLGIGRPKPRGGWWVGMDMINPFFVWPLKDGTNTTLKYLHGESDYLIIYNRFTSLPSRLGHVNINQTFILPSGPRFF